MNIGLTGATGFIGRHFARLAIEAGHKIIAFSRRPQKGQRKWDDLDFYGLDAMVHLAGESVFGLWTKGKKQRIRSSRVVETNRMVQAMRKLEVPPKVVISASGAAYYGDRGDEVLTEQSLMGGGFLAGVTQDWESSVGAAGDFARTASLRFGIVLGPDGGGWPLLRKIFNFGIGGKLGSGKQWMPWIHVDDVVGLLLYSVEHESMFGPINGVAPEAVTNETFTKTLGAALHRSTFLTTPEFALKMLPGGMSEMFLDSARIKPAMALNSGYVFKHPTLKGALESLLAER